MRTGDGRGLDGGPDRMRGERRARHRRWTGARERREWCAAMADAMDDVRFKIRRWDRVFDIDMWRAIHVVLHCNISFGGHDELPTSANLTYLNFILKGFKLK